MKNPFKNEMEFTFMRSMFPKELLDHSDKVDSGNIIPEYVKIQQKKSNLSRRQRDTIVWNFERYKAKGFYSERDLEKIKQLILN